MPNQTLKDLCMLLIINTGVNSNCTMLIIQVLIILQLTNQRKGWVSPALQIYIIKQHKYYKGHKQLTKKVKQQ